VMLVRPWQSSKALCSYGIFLWIYIKLGN